MTEQNRKETIKHLHEATTLYARNGLQDHVNSMDGDISIDNIKMSVYIQDMSLVDWKSKNKFVKSFDTVLLSLVNSKYLTVEEYGLFSMLSLYLDYQSNYLKLNANTYLTQKDIIKITDFSRRKVSVMLNKLINKELLFEEKQPDDKRLKRYFINPHYFYRGKLINKDIKERFTES